MRALHRLLNKQMMPFFITLFCLLSATPGCSLKEIHEQTEIIENRGYVKGNIKLLTKQQGAMIILLFHEENGIPVFINQFIAPENGDFLIPVIPGNYYIAAFIDVNKNGSYQPTEHGAYHGIPSKIVVKHKQTVALEPITISGQLPKQETSVKAVTRVKAIWENVGQVTTLDDTRFSRDNYSMGLWRPFDFLEHAEGGLFFLEKYQHNKVPVIFVHGVLGGPTDWKNVVKSLDREHFQPWMLYYPSGIRLDMLSDYLVQTVSRLQNKYGFKKFCVIAHSMGGLVTRSFVKKYVDHNPENLNRLRLVMTINSPMAGMTSAAAGVKNSPIVVPSWRDVEPGSAFLKDIHTWQWPHEIPYHLVFSYTNDESGDGVVTLNSQAPQKLQSESTRMYVFNNDHVGTLSDKTFLGLFNRILNDNF